MNKYVMLTMEKKATLKIELNAKLKDALIIGTLVIVMLKKKQNVIYLMDNQVTMNMPLDAKRELVVHMT